MRSYHCHVWYKGNDEFEYEFIDAEDYRDAINKASILLDEKPYLDKIEFWNDIEDAAFMWVKRHCSCITNVEEFWLEDD